MTWQIKDTILFNDKRYYLNINLLDRYFSEFNERRPQINVYDSSCWRGHQIDFEVKNETLTIKAVNFLSENNSNEEKNFLDKYFPNRKFDWFSGLLRIDNYKGQYDNDCDLSSIYEFLEFKRGDFMSHWKFNMSEYLEFKTLLFSEFRKIKEYDVLFFKLKSDNSKMKYNEIDDKIKQNIIFHINENYLKIY